MMFAKFSAALMLTELYYNITALYIKAAAEKNKLFFFYNSLPLAL